MSRSFIELDKVSYTYTSENNQVLRTFSLTIKEGDISTILGPNGIGKTTLLHLILGWIKTNEGSIVLSGRRLGDYSRKEMGQLVGLVPQDEHIAFEYTLLEYVLLGRSPHLHALESPRSHDYAMAMKALERVGLGDLAERSVTHLSGGEKQLVLIARSLAQDPAILLLDEPMSNLDLSNKKRILEVLLSLKKEGVTILFTSHEPDIAASISDYLILMGQNYTIEQGSVEEVFTRESLSRVYNIPINIVEVQGRKMVLWH
jgi:iron complex transport system ATP-binding protein